MNTSVQSTETNKLIVKRFIKEAFENFNANAMPELVSEHFRSRAWSGFEDGLQGMKHFTAFLGTVFSNARVTLESILAEGDKVAASYTLEATYTGTFMGKAAGHRVRLPGVLVVCVEGGKIAEYFNEEAQPEIVGKLESLQAA